MCCAKTSPVAENTIADGLYFKSLLQNEICLAWIDGIGETEAVSNSEQTCNASSATMGCTVPGEEGLTSVLAPG